MSWDKTHNLRGREEGLHNKYIALLEYRDRFSRPQLHMRWCDAMGMRVQAGSCNPGISYV